MQFAPAVGVPSTVEAHGICAALKISLPFPRAVRSDAPSYHTYHNSMILFLDPTHAFPVIKRPDLKFPMHVASYVPEEVIASRRLTRAQRK